MVQTDPGKNTYRLIRHINAFLRLNSDKVAIAIDYFVKFLAVSLFLIFLSIAYLGFMNIFFWANPWLGLFQFAFLLYWYKYQWAKRWKTEMSEEAHYQQEAIEHLVDLVQKVAAPNATVNPFEQIIKKKKTRLN
jgi:hypothetical protein